MGRFTHLLMTSVTVNDVSIDNMCVINAAIVCFFTADGEEGLRMLLHEVVQHHLQTTPCSPGKTTEMKRSEFSEAFRRLLDFWEDFYRGHQGDRKVLEFSSGLTFEQLKEVVEMARKELLAVAGTAAAAVATVTEGVGMGVGGEKAAAVAK